MQTTVVFFNGAFFAQLLSDGVIAKHCPYSFSD
jgi:hypothetical protein